MVRWPIGDRYLAVGEAGIHIFSVRRQGDGPRYVELLTYRRYVEGSVVSGRYFDELSALVRERFRAVVDNLDDIDLDNLDGTLPQLVLRGSSEIDEGMQAMIRSGVVKAILNSFDIDPGTADTAMTRIVAWANQNINFRISKPAILGARTSVRSVNAGIHELRRPVLPRAQVRS